MRDDAKIGSGAGVEDWIDCADILGEMTVGVDIGEGDSFTTTRDGRKIYGLRDAVLQVFELSGLGLELPVKDLNDRALLDVAIGHLGMHMQHHIAKGNCGGGGYFVELDEIAEIIDIECASCSGNLRTINIG